METSTSGGDETMGPANSKYNSGKFIFIAYNNSVCARGTIMVKELCYKPEGCGFQTE
jgi:hypothetical protein